MNTTHNKAERAAAVAALISVTDALVAGGMNSDEAEMVARREVCGEFGCTVEQLASWDVELVPVA